MANGGRRRARLLERGVSTARVVFAFNSANVESWALYAEAVMKECLPVEGRFDELVFHDFIVNQGLLPFDLLEQAVMTELVPAKE